MPETTALDLITSGLVEIGVYADPETLSDADAQRGLTILNRMLDSWSNEDLICFAQLEQSGTLSPGKFQYKIGAGATFPDFPLQRPIRLKVGPGSAYLLDPTGNRYPVDVYTRETWNQIGNISNVTANIPAAIFYDSQFPLATINVFPVPNIGYTLFWDSYLQLTEFSDLDDPVTLPPGYIQAIVSALKWRFWRPFKPDNAPIPPDIILEADGAKMVVKRANHTEVIAVYDSEIISHALPTYNIYRGM
jgi:hypothetical protein